MSRDEYEAALAAYLRSKTITRCPTVCAVPTQASVGEADRLAYRAYVTAREAQRRERLRALQDLLHHSTPAAASDQRPL
jgi:hypothetical protein